VAIQLFQISNSDVGDSAVMRFGLNK